MDTEPIRKLAESAERRAQELHILYQEQQDPMSAQVRSFLNDFFYWSGKATAYRGVIAMVELQTVVEEELDAEGSCP